MNIKGFGVNLPTQVESQKSSETPEKMRMESSGDRDADGRRQNQSGQDEGPPTEEQVQKAMEYLKEHPGVKENNLTVMRKEAAGKIVLVLQDHLGKVIRRIPEAQVRAIGTSVPTQSQKGQIFHRAM